jgi:hypothetical protein
MMKKGAFAFAVVLLTVTVGGKGGRGGAQEPTLRLAMIPSIDPGKIARDSQPLVKYHEKETSSRIELVVPTNYAAVVEAIANYGVDIAYLGGFTCPLLSSYTVLRWETNLRASTILGLVGGGGLGQAIYNNVQLGFYNRLSTLILLIYALVLASDWIGERLRLNVA